MKKNFLFFLVFKGRKTKKKSGASITKKKSETTTTTKKIGIKYKEEKLHWIEEFKEKQPKTKKK